MTDTGGSEHGLEVAIVGMSGRFPGARDLDQLWRNLRDGVESISRFSVEEAAAAGARAELLDNPHYVRAAGVLADVELFDAAFFGFHPREAELMDPQHRIFLECAWEALERAGYADDSGPELIGVYAGASLGEYLLGNLLTNPELMEATSIDQLIFSNDKDYVPTRVSYKCDLRGPSINVQTACSTSLVAVHLACQGLLNYQCDVALAGGVSVNLPQKRGYLYLEGGIGSPDGHCRAFDAQAAGTVSGNGVGIVVLKRLADALADGDHIHAVIKGSAINNDGALKVGFTAPSVEGQARVIAAAQSIAGVSPGEIGYVEAHGTGTALGDPVEIAALSQVFRQHTDKRGYCAIGSLKTNLGHLDAAAGVGGLIKTVLALEHELLPPSLNYERPNPKIDFASSPFYVNAALARWQAPEDGGPRRAGVSSFGIGGTNAHVILEQAPAPNPSSAGRPWLLLTLSAKTPSALDSTTANLAAHLEEHPDLDLADVAYTHHVGRRRFDHRRIVVCGLETAAAARALETRDPRRVFSAAPEPGARAVAFMFSGQGSQTVDMGRELYQSEPVFRQQVDHCADLLLPHLDLDLRELLYPAAERASEAAAELRLTHRTQPALLAIEYALARLWIDWGVEPQALIGHSIGEYTAACLAGVFSLPDALALVAERGRLMQQQPPGAMLSVSLSADEVQPLLSRELALAAVNAPALCVVSGPTAAVEAFESRLARREVASRRLHTSHAFHSPMMEPILESFARTVAQVERHPPRIPFVSNVTGTWITAREAMDPSYWARHARQTVRFADGLETLLAEPSRILLEVGPGHALSTFGRLQRAAVGDSQLGALPSLSHPRDTESDLAAILTTLGKLWLAGVPVDWPRFHAHERRRRLPLPTYPFERQRYWIEPGDPQHARPAAPRKKKQDVAEWLYLPSWKRRDLLPPAAPKDLFDPEACWLIFDEDGGLGLRIAERLARLGLEAVRVTAGERFAQLDAGTWTIHPRQKDDYAALIRTLCAERRPPTMIVHLWGVTGDDPPAGHGDLDATLTRGFYSLIFLAQALGGQNVTQPIQLGVVSTNLQEVTGAEALCPAKATALGPCRVIPQEYSNVTCRSIDIAIDEPAAPPPETLVDSLIAELVAKPPELTVAYRGHHRWVQLFEPLRQEAAGRPTRLRDEGVYLITGGLGRIGLATADYLARASRARLVLVGRSVFPDRAEWASWLASHDEQDGVSRKIRRLQALEALGAEVLVIRADVADKAQMQEALGRAERRFGALHGVIHGAGIVGEDALAPLQDTDLAAGERQFQAKVRGTLVLEEVLEGRQLDFCLLQSSLAAVLGGLGFTAYAAANCFLDALAHRHRARGAGWVSVNWDGWAFDRDEGSRAATTLADMEIEPAEGMRALGRILSLGLAPQVVVSTGDLQARIEQWVEKDPGEQPAPTAYHPRPTLQADYVPPQTEIEKAIVVMWQEVLGIEQIGTGDDFFALGGHSLLATQLTSRLRDAFHVDLSLRDFFEAPTVAGLARSIETVTWAAQDQQSPAGAAVGDREEGDL